MEGEKRIWAQCAATAPSPFLLCHVCITYISQVVSSPACVFLRGKDWVEEPPDEAQHWSHRRDSITVFSYNQKSFYVHCPIDLATLLKYFWRVISIKHLTYIIYFIQYYIYWMQHYFLSLVFTLNIVQIAWENSVLTQIFEMWFIKTTFHRLWSYIPQPEKFAFFSNLQTEQRSAHPPFFRFLGNDWKPHMGFQIRNVRGWWQWNCIS